MRDPGLRSKTPSAYPAAAVWFNRQYICRLSAAELELISTLLFADREAPHTSQSIAQLSGLLHEIKPHFDLSVIKHQAEWLRDLDLLESIG